MIAEKDYLKFIIDMNEKEKQDYIDRIKRWDEETLPKLLALADSWEKVPVKDFDEGLKIASALISARSFIPVARQFPINEALKYLNGYIADVRKRTGLAKMQGRPAGDTTHYRAIVPEKGKPQEDGTLKRQEYKPEEVDGRRPEHLHEYIHLLPDALKKKTTRFEDLYLALAEYRGRVEALSENPNADAEMIASYAKKAIDTEQEIRNIWAEVDEAYAYAVKHGGGPKPEPVNYSQMLKAPGAYSKEEIDEMPDPSQREFCKEARIKSNRDYLRRSDVKLTDKFKEELTLRIGEMLAWDIELQPKVKRRIEEMGLKIKGYNDDEPKEAENSSDPCHSEHGEESVGAKQATFDEEEDE